MRAETDTQTNKRRNSGRDVYQKRKEREEEDRMKITQEAK